MRQNPVQRLRKEHGLTQEQAAGEAGCHVHAFLLQEQGVYPNLLPAILAWLALHEAYLPDMQAEYKRFQSDKRKENGELFGLPIYEMGAPGHTHPFIQFRSDLGLSRLGFAKAFCVHPGLLYRLEQGIAKGLSGQLERSLREAGLSELALKELKYRIREIG